MSIVQETTVSKEIPMSPGINPTNRRKWKMLLLLGTFVFAEAQAQEHKMSKSDLESYMAAMKVDRTEAERRMIIQSRLGNLERYLAKESGDIFGGLWIEHQPTFSVQVRFTQTSRGQAALSAADKLLAPDLQVGWSPVSLRELEALQIEVVSHLQKLNLKFESDLDVVNSAVELITTNRAEIEAALNSFHSLAESRLIIVPVASLSQPLAAMQGGRPLYDCSTAFTARNSSGSVGVLTAAHCYNPNMYMDTQSIINELQKHFGGSLDVAFKSRSCDLTVSSEFDSGAGIRQVTGTLSRDQVAVGSFLCLNGKSTHYKCGILESRNYCPSFWNTGANFSPTFGIIRSFDGSPMMTNGDSGGAVFIESLAVGIVNASTRVDTVCYTPVNFLSSVGISILTSPGGIGSMSASMSCWDNYAGSTYIGCQTTAGGGVPPFNYSWSYWGSGVLFGSGQSAYAEYAHPGCPLDQYNSFMATATDSCGSSTTAWAEASCLPCSYAQDGSKRIQPCF